MLSEGLPGWEKKGYAIVASEEYRKNVTMKKLTPRELQSLLQKKSDALVLIDIREPPEYAEGHIKGSVNIPLTEFSKVSAQVPMGKRIIIACSTGARTYNAYRQLRRMGHIDISQVILDEWEEAGLKLQTSPPH